MASLWIGCWPRAARAALGAVVLAPLAVLLLPTPAGAHARLVDVSPPPDGAVLEGPPPTVTLTFNEVVEARYTVVAVQDDGEDVGEVPVATAGRSISVDLGSLQESATSGTLTIAYRIVSVDGHPVEGRAAYEVAAPPPSTTTAPAPTTTASPAAPGSSTDRPTGAPSATSPAPSPAGSTASGAALVWDGIIVLLAALLVVLFVVVWRLGRKHRAGEDGTAPPAPHDGPRA